jgi:hypothetical protein
MNLTVQMLPVPQPQTLSGEAASRREGWGS